MFNPFALFFNLQNYFYIIFNYFVFKTKYFPFLGSRIDNPIEDSSSSRKNENISSYNHNITDYNSSYKMSIKHNKNSTLNEINNQKNFANFGLKNNQNNSSRIVNKQDQRLSQNVSKLNVNVKDKSNKFYVPPGGWPPRTRTGPDGRRLFGNSIINGARKTAYYQNRTHTNLQTQDKKEFENEDTETYDEDESLTDSRKKSDEKTDENDDNEDDDDENRAIFLNEMGEKIKPENGEKVKHLWNDLGRVIEEKPWQKSLTSAKPSQKNEKFYQKSYWNNAQNFPTSKKQKEIKLITKSLQINQSILQTTQPPSITRTTTLPSSNEKLMTVSKVWIPYHYKKNTESRELNSRVSKNSFQVKKTTTATSTTSLLPKIKNSILPITKADSFAKVNLAMPSSLKSTASSTTISPESIMHFTFVG